MENTENTPEDARRGHRKRLRERFLKSGLDGFHDYEVVELLLSLGIPRRDCKLPAKEAIKKLRPCAACWRPPPRSSSNMPWTWMGSIQS